MIVSCPLIVSRHDMNDMQTLNLRNKNGKYNSFYSWLIIPFGIGNSKSFPFAVHSNYIENCKIPSEWLISLEGLILMRH